MFVARLSTFHPITIPSTKSEISALVIKFVPSVVVLACGDKDMENGATALSTATRFGNVVDVLKANNIPAFTLSMKPSPSSASLLSMYQSYDTLVQAKAASVTQGTIPWLTVIDVYSSFMALDNPATLYAADESHLSTAGYEYWKTWLDSALESTSWSSEGFATSFGSSCCLLWRSNCCTQHAGAGCNMQNNCNGHGVCNYCTRTCSCFEGWGADTDVSLFKARDCSRRVCPHGAAFVDVPTEANKAHSSVECSNKGICDFTTGTCLCFAGFTGSACQRSVCPYDCSGHGSCISVREMATLPYALPLSPITTYDSHEVKPSAAIPWLVVRLTHF